MRLNNGESIFVSLALLCNCREEWKQTAKGFSSSKLIRRKADNETPGYFHNDSQHRHISSLLSMLSFSLFT